MRRLRSCWVGLLGILVLVPMVASAQAISGTVADSSGSVLPGVTVEASSPALIEKARSVVTNEAGRYSIVNLRPGTYVVTFTLVGFSTVRREGIVLTSDFTAQANAELAVGALQESITVTSASPVVDVQGTATPRVLTREVMDALPTDRSVTGLANTLPGTGPGPFGQIAYRGTFDAVTSVDGMRTTHLTGAGPAMTATPYNNAQFQEFSFSTAIESAEMGQPGLRINLVPRDGGNQFSGSLFTTFTHDGWQSGNVDGELGGFGFTDVKTLKSWDVNPSFGGPIVRDKLWFFTTFRSAGSDTQAVDFAFDANPDPFIYTPGDAGTLENWNVNGSGRVTFQATAKDKISAFYEKPYTLTPFSRNPQLGTNPPPEATVRAEGDNQNYGLRWTRTHTPKLLFEASFSDFDTIAYNDYGGNMEPWGATHVQSPPSGRPPAMAILDRVTNRQIGVANVAGGNDSTTMTFASSATYVTGSHTLKTGFTYFRGTYKRPQTVAGNVVLAVNNRVVDGTTRRAAEFATLTLPSNEINDINGDWGIYVQDRWSLNRLTINAGLRFDWLMTSVPEQVLPASRWLDSVTFAPLDIVNLKDLSPRLGAAYDLFGNGKTAVKVALARYVAGETVALTRAVNPMLSIATTDQRTWNDLNGDQTILNPDGSLQASELGPSTNLNFGRPTPQTRFDPNVLDGWFNRGYSWETNVSVQHEIVPRVSGTVLWYRRTAGNQRTNDNQRVTPADYDEFCVTGPADSRLPGGGGERICGLYDLKPALRGQVDNLSTFAANLGAGRGFKDITDGFEFSVNARLPRGAFIQGGINLNRTLTNSQRTVATVPIQPCDVIDSPETRFCETRTHFLEDFKVQGNHTLPLAIEVAATYAGLAGPEVLSAWSVPNALITQALGRAPTAASKTVALIEPGTQYEDMRHIFNVRFGRTFRVDRLRLKLNLDLDNLFNSNALTSIRTQFGNEWLRPAGILAGRQFRLGTQIDF